MGKLKQLALSRDILGLMNSITELPSLKNIIKSQCEGSGMSLIACDSSGRILLQYFSKSDKASSSMIKDHRLKPELLECLASDKLNFSNSVKEITFNNLHLFCAKMKMGAHTIFILSGLFLCENKRRKKKEGGRFAPDTVKFDCPGLENKIEAKKRKDVFNYKIIVKNCSELINQLFRERYLSSQYFSRMSTLYDISRKVNSTLKLKEVLKQVLDSAIGLLGAQAGSIMLLEKGGEELRIFVAYGLSEEIIKSTRVKVGEGISGGVAESGKPRLLLSGVRVSDSFSSKRKVDIKSAICVPLKAKKQVIGVLNVSGKEGGGNFLQEDLALLEIMASNAAVAIYNANLFSSLDQKAKELQALYGIATTLTTSIERKKVLHKVLKSAQRLLRAKKGSLMLLEKETETLSIEVAYGLSKKIQESARPKLGEGIAGKVALEGKPRLMLKGIKVSESKTEKKAKEIPSAICVPIKVKDKIIGVLNVSDRDTGENFTQESMDLLLMLANQAAVAIENSRLMEELHELFVGSITALANAIDARDPYTRGHSQRVTEYSLHIARKMGLPHEEIEYIQYAALLHDIGKIHIRDDILNKPGKLTDEEFEEMQKHPVYGAKIMEPVKRFRDILPYMYHHHERFAGEGYPHNLGGDDIPLPARIISVADSFDAMTSDRPYRKGFSVEKAVEEMIKCSGTQFDPQVVDVFLKLIEQDTAIQQILNTRE